MKKVLALALSLSLILAIGVAGTLAWLTSTTTPITNTFTLGSLTAELYETDPVTKAKASEGLAFTNVAPGDVLHKDPTINLTTGSGWVFIGVSNPNGTNITFTPGTGWTKVGTYTQATINYDVYGYGTVVNKDAPQTLFNTVTVANTVANNATINPITVIGFAVQTETGTTAQAAWSASFGAPTL